jgi:hypothetical protein
MQADGRSLFVNDHLLPRAIDRRRLLLGFGAVAGFGTAAPVVWRVASAGAADAAIDAPLAVAPGTTACFAPLTADTMAAVAAFVVPGDDEYSQAQGVVAPGPGAVAARSGELVALVLNQVLMDPTALTRIIQELGDLLRSVPLPDGTDACTALGSAIKQQGTVPLAPLVVALVNALALLVQPASATGPLGSPFARLSWSDKARVWERFERDVPALLMPAPWKLETPVLDAAVALFETLGGLLAYASGAILELAGFFAYSEVLAFDRAAGRLVDRPLGWELSRYVDEMPDARVAADGWDELIGYYQGRTSVDA